MSIFGDGVCQSFAVESDANSGSETTTMEHRDQRTDTDALHPTLSQSRLHPGTLSLKNSESGIWLDVSMATFRGLSLPEQQQVVIDTLHAFIQEERRHNYDFLGKYSHRYIDQAELLSVEASDGLYTFTDAYPYGCERRAHVDVLLSHDATLTIADLIITPIISGSTSTTSPAAAWLRETYHWDNTWELHQDREEQYAEQRRWWAQNGLSFPLLFLPAELREGIYLQAIGPIVLPSYRKNKISLGNGFKHKKPREGIQRDPDIPPPNLSVLHLCIQIRHEALHVATRNTTKRIHAPFAPVSELCATIMYLDHFARFGFLRVLQLEFTAKQCFDFAGVPITAGIPLFKYAGPKGFDVLTNLRSLKELDWRFLGPKHSFAVCPWSKAENGNKGAVHSCQAIWIDWFFTLAWGHIQKLLQSGVKMSMSGCVKTTTLTYWTRVFVFRNSDKEHIAQEIGEKRKQIMSRKWDGKPIPCRCKSMCGRDPQVRSVKWSEAELRQMEGLKEEVEGWYWTFEG